jgi:two-component system invasion response regulator UvrY
MINVYVIDDHSLIREGIKKIVNDETDMEIIGESTDGLDVLNFLEEKEPDIIILDISMPKKSGLELLKEIKRLYQSIPVLILSMHPEDQYAIRSLRSGASGYLTKESIPEELVEAIHKIISGGKYINSLLGEKLASSLEIWSDKPLHDSLSDREFQVMLMIGSGKKNFRNQ